jgi:hypothetical protein
MKNDLLYGDTGALADAPVSPFLQKAQHRAAEIGISLDLSPEKRIIKQYKTLKEDSYGTHLYQ